jgi:hypothetical protein
MCSSLPSPPLPFPSFPPLHIPTQRPVILTDFFFWFSSVPPGQSRDSTLNYATTAFFHILTNSSLTHYPFISRYTVRVFFFSPEGGVGLVPQRGCLHTLAFHAFPRWYEFGERRWNDIYWRENRRTWRKTYPSSTLSTTNPTWIDSGVNPGLRGERPATDDLSQCTALR